MVGVRAYNYIKPLQITNLLGVGANAHPYNSEVGASLNCINFVRVTESKTPNLIQINDCPLRGVA